MKLKHSYTQDQVDRVRDLAEKGMTRVDIRLMANIPMFLIERISMSCGVQIRNGHSIISPSIGGLSVEDRIGYIFTHYPDLEINASDVAYCIGGTKGAGSSKATRDALDRLVYDGFLACRKLSLNHVVYRLAQPAKPASVESTKTIDFKCGESVRSLLVEIRDLLKLKLKEERSDILPADVKDV